MPTHKKQLDAFRQARSMCRLTAPSVLVGILCMSVCCNIPASDSSQSSSSVDFRDLESKTLLEWRLYSMDNDWKPADKGLLFRDRVKQLFALSPSLLDLELYATSLDRSSNELSPAEKSVAIATLQSMIAGLSRDFATEPTYPAAFTMVPSSVNAPVGSLFKDSYDVIGWTNPGSAPALEMKPNIANRNLAVEFDGPSAMSLSPIYEMAKQLRRNIKLEATTTTMPEADSQFFPAIQYATINVELPAYAITTKGIVPGKFERAGYFGGACESEQPTAAEFILDKPVSDQVIGVFATGLVIDVKQVRVTTKQEVFPNFSGEYNNDSAVTVRTIYTVDLNGDGVPELRGINRSDTEPDPDMLIIRDNTFGSFPLVPVAGWYGGDFDELDANIDGNWYQLSFYQVLTCT